MSHAKLSAILFACSLCAAASCSNSAAQTKTGGGAWIANGATACEKYLTPGVVAEILTNPAGQSKTLSAQSCTYETADNSGSISITLTNAGPSAFDAYQQYLADPVPLAGVGDKASRSIIGIDAVKGADRSGSIDAGGPPGSTKLRGEALAQKLGAICNKLFALP